MAQVPAVLTPSTSAHIAGAIILAYGDLRGRMPPAKTSWLWPLALGYNETAGWKSMRNWNVGNVTTAGDPAAWFINPYVTKPLKFLSFNDARSGSLSMLKVLDKYGGIDAADIGDETGWQNALNKYLGSGYPSPWPLVSKLQNVQPEGVELITAPSLNTTARRAPLVFTVAAVAALVAAAATYTAKHQRHVIWQS